MERLAANRAEKEFQLKSVQSPCVSAVHARQLPLKKDPGPTRDFGGTTPGTGGTPRDRQGVIFEGSKICIFVFFWFKFSRSVVCGLCGLETA